MRHQMRMNFKRRATWVYIEILYIFTLCQNGWIAFFVVVVVAEIHDCNYKCGRPQTLLKLNVDKLYIE